MVRYVCTNNVVVVNHKVSGSNISRTFRPRSTTFYTDIYADLFFSHIGINIISYFWSSFIEFRKKNENAASDGFGSNLSGAVICLLNQLLGFLFCQLRWSI